MLPLQSFNPSLVIDTHMKSRYVLQACHDTRDPSHPCAPPCTNPRQELIHDEQVVLRLLHFQLHVQHPHVWLLNVCETMGAPPKVVALATCLVRCCMCAAALCRCVLLKQCTGSAHSRTVEYTHLHATGVPL